MGPAPAALLQRQELSPARFRGGSVGWDGAVVPGCCAASRTEPPPGRPPASAAPPGQRGAQGQVEPGPPCTPPRPRASVTSPGCRAMPRALPHVSPMGPGPSAAPLRPHLGQALGVSGVPGDDLLQALEPVVDGGLVQRWPRREGGSGEASPGPPNLPCALGKLRHGAPCVEPSRGQRKGGPRGLSNHCRDPPHITPVPPHANHRSPFPWHPHILCRLSPGAGSGHGDPTTPPGAVPPPRAAGPSPV